LRFLHGLRLRRAGDALAVRNLPGELLGARLT